MNNTEIWKIFKEKAKKQLPGISGILENAELLGIHENIMTVKFGGYLAYQYFSEHYEERTAGILSDIMGKNMKIAYEFSDSIPDYPENTGSPYAIPGIHRSKGKPNLSHAMSFENYAIMKSNSTPAGLGKQMAKPEKCSFSPMYIYGDSCTGKTHLLNAIGAEAKKHSSPVYVEASCFLSQVLFGGKISMLQYYDQFDVILFDNVQKLSGSSSAQSVLLGLLENFSTNGKKAAITANGLPNAFCFEGNSLASRLKSGAITEIYLPCYELRTEITRKKAAMHKIGISDENIFHIASRARDGSEINGIIIAISILPNPDDDNQIFKIIEKYTEKRKKNFSVKLIKDTVCSYFSMDPWMLNLKTRKREIVQARQVSMYFSKLLTKSSLATIGFEIGGKDHATVLHACRTVKNLMETNKRFRGQVEEIGKIFE